MEAMGMEVEDNEDSDGSNPTTSIDETDMSIENDQVDDKTIQLRNFAMRKIIADPFQFLYITRSYVSDKSNRFKLFGKTFSLQFNENGKAAAHFGLGLILMEALFINLTKKFAKYNKSQKDFYIQFSVDSEDLSQPVTSPYLIAEPNSVAQYLTDLTMTSTSHPLMFLDKQFTISVQCIGVEVESEKFQEDTFGALSRNNVSNDLEFLVRKKGFVCFVPNILYSNDCLLVCIALGLRLLGQWKRVKNSGGRAPNMSPSSIRRQRMFSDPLQSKELKIMVRKLSRAIANGQINWNIPQTRNTCKLAQDYLNDHCKAQLIIYRSSSADDIYFQGYPKRKVDDRISLILVNHHLSLIMNPLSYFNRKQCPNCLTLYKNKNHFCPMGSKKCKKCGRDNCDTKMLYNRVFQSTCDDCDGYFLSKQCYENHLVVHEDCNESQCESYVYCTVCGKQFPRSCLDENGQNVENHSCLITQCYSCGKIHDDLKHGRRHLCALRKAKLKEIGISKEWAEQRGISTHSKEIKSAVKVSSLNHYKCEDLHKDYSKIVGDVGIVAYDLETRCNVEGRLYPYLATAIYMCSQCAFENYLSPEKWPRDLPCCGQRVRKYVGELGMKEFILDLFFRKKHNKATAWSFNGSAFDNIFIMDTLIQNGCVPQLKMKGRRVMLLRLNNVTLKDLRFFLSGSLSSIPKNFKLETIVEKG